MARVRVPVIDMQKGEGLGEEIVKAFEEWGCFRMLNHGVPPQLMAEMKAVVAALFDLPEEIQSQTTYTKHGMGYIRRGLVNQIYEGLSVRNIFSSDDVYDGLDISTHQRETIRKYIKDIRDLAELLGRKLMEGHGLVGDLFDGWCCELRMNEYHFCNESLGLLGSDLHSDPSFLTILQDDENVNGLQVVDKYSGEFVQVDHIPGTLLVNIGDIGKQIWSNGRYCNVIHRVCCFEPKIRSSIAFFVEGPTDKKLEAPSKLVDSDHPRLYVPIDFKEFRQVRQSRGAITGGAPNLFLVNSAT